ncbi:hypothetical protein PO002_05015 [Cupriavidus necator]|uniref:hypothetical protein n=1 Tax=Cupriavidus necator TaxID=106590 RepID=UPI0039C2F2BF
MKVKANWPVDTGSKVHQAGDKFDLPDDQAAQLEQLGAVEVLGRKKPAAKGSDTPPAGGEGDSDEDGAGDGDGEDDEGGAGDGGQQG